MPIDPNLIGNAVANWQHPAAFDPLAQYAKIQALKNGIGQQQLQQQALQEGALGLQEKQREISGREALANAIQQSVKPGQNGAPPTIDHNNVAQILGSGPNADLIPGYMAGVAKQDADKAAAEKVQLENRASSLEQATRGFNAATDQKTWDSALSILHGLGLDSSKLGIPDVFSPAAKTAVINLGLSIKDQLAAAAQAKTAQAAADRATAAGTQADTAKEKERLAKVTAAKQAIGAATDQASLQGAFNNVVAAGATPEEVAQLPHVFSPQVVDAYRRSLLTGEQQTQADQAALNAKNTEADRKARLKIDQQNAGINAQKFALEFGGDAVKGWAKQVADNPDTANQVPPALRTQVMAAHTALTGLPFPKPLTGTAVDQERASRNALDAVAAVKEALADPEIQARVGPILGRLGSAEQSAGTAIGLSPQAAAKAQQLRTNMRYLVFQEGKALLGGRMPQQLMQQLEQSSPNVAMDAGTLNGALAGVTDAAGRNLDQTFKQRYGEQAQRPGSSAKPAGAAAVPTAVKDALKNAGPGIHTLSDKSRWMVGADGTITPQ